MTHTGKHGDKRAGSDPLELVQERNRAWWETTPMTYDWRAEGTLRPLTLAWFDDQDRRSDDAHRYFAATDLPFDRLIRSQELASKEVLEIGVGSGYHSELLARAGAVVTGIDLTEAAVAATTERFRLKGLDGTFERFDAEEPRQDFVNRFHYVWSWGVIHHSAHTARIVRNVDSWLKSDGAFGGMVYHRDSVSAMVKLLRDGVLRGGLLSYSIDELLWRSTDGYSARFYPADQWRDLLLAFFDEAEVAVNGIETDVLPLPRAL